MGLWERLRSLITGDHFREEDWQEWEDCLVEGDLGYDNAQAVVALLRQRAREARWRDPEQVRGALVTILAGMVQSASLSFEGPAPHVVLVLGVNGVGKTTSIAKLAHRYQREGRRVVLAAGDTFRAAAVEQLALWSQRLGVRLVSQGQNADPAAVIFDAIASAQARGEDLVLADTAGRLHNKNNLVQELVKVNKVVSARVPPGSYRKLLVIDTVTGQNAVEQADVFHRAVGVDALLLSKWDASARGGSVLGIARKLGIGVAFVGVGEKAADLETFDPQRFAEAIVGA